MTRDQMITLFKNIDENNSGEVCFQEFADFLFPEMDFSEDEARSPKSTQDMKNYSPPYTPHVTPPTQVKL